MSAARQVDFLLIGGGMASAHCAAQLRDRGAEGSIAIVSREADPPYERPPLSKEYLRGEAERADAYVHAPEWYAQNSVDLLSGTSVTSLDTEERVAKLQGGEEIGFDKALIGTGAIVNILRVEGGGVEGIHYLRAFGNSDSIRQDTEGAEHVVLIGGSFIATEVAASLTAKGKRCTLLMMEDIPLSGVFGDEVGRYFEEVLTGHGVEIVAGAELEAFEGDKRVEAVLTTDGRRIECDAVVVGAGVRADTTLAEKSGIEVGDGIICDENLETSVAGIFAAGDCCSYESRIHGRRLRVEHWDVAMQQGQWAARNMLGAGEPYEVVPYFFSDLADWASLEYVGPAHEWDDLIWRGDRDAGKFSAWYLKDSRVAATLSVDRSEDLGHARQLLADGVDVSESKPAIADVDSDLSELTE